MSQESEHGKWTVSSSEESGDEHSAQVEKRSAPQFGQEDQASGPRYPCSEARKAAYKRKSSSKLNDGNCPQEMAPASKQRPPQEGLGWCLSSSDEEDEPKGQGGGAASFSKKEPCASKEKASTELPSCHKSAELADTWDLLDGGNPFRFFLTKVKGIKSKYNSGALHIKGK